MTRLVVGFLAKSKGLVFPLPSWRQVDKFGILVIPYGGPTPSQKSALRDGGGGSNVDRSLVVTNDDPKPLLLGLTSP